MLREAIITILYILVKNRCAVGCVSPGAGQLLVGNASEACGDTSALGSRTSPTLVKSERNSIQMVANRVAERPQDGSRSSDGVVAAVDGDGQPGDPTGLVREQEGDDR